MKLLIILVPCLICWDSYGQVFHPSTQAGTFRAEETTILGYYSIIPYSTEVVEKSLLTYMRDHGRTERMKGYFLTTDISNLTETNLEILIFSKVEATGIRSQVWMGIDTSVIGAVAHQDLNPQIEKLLLNFGRNVHLQNLQNQIVMAERAAIAKSREYQKLVNQESTLERKLDLNQAERIRFEEALEKNSLERHNLTERAELNLKLQQLASEELHKINEGVDQLRIKVSEFQSTF